MIWTLASPCIRFATFMAFLSLILGKLVKVASPIALKYAVDALTNV